jgi:hypothetical protein
MNWNKSAIDFIKHGAIPMDMTVYRLTADKIDELANLKIPHRT